MAILGTAARCRDSAPFSPVWSSASIYSTPTTRPCVSGSQVIWWSGGVVLCPPLRELDAGRTAVAATPVSMIPCLAALFLSWWCCGHGGAGEMWVLVMTSRPLPCSRVPGVEADGTVVVLPWRYWCGWYTGDVGDAAVLDYSPALMPVGWCCRRNPGIASPMTPRQYRELNFWFHWLHSLLGTSHWLMSVILYCIGCCDDLLLACCYTQLRCWTESLIQFE
jgi:hypothetical protein